MDRESLRGFIGKRVIGAARLGRTSYGETASPGRTAVLEDTHILGIDNTIDHMWITKSEGMVGMRKGAVFVFTAEVTEYLSLDKDGTQVMKIGLANIKNVTRFKRGHKGEVMRELLKNRLDVESRMLVKVKMHEYTDEDFKWDRRSK